MSSGTADALGLSRAILCNGEPIIRGSVNILPLCTSYIYSQIYLLGYVLDGLVKKLEELEKTAELYKGKSVLYFCRVEVFSSPRFNTASPQYCLPCRADGAHKEAAASFLWALPVSQRWVAWELSLTILASCRICQTVRLISSSSIWGCLLCYRRARAPGSSQWGFCQICRCSP